MHLVFTSVVMQVDSGMRVVYIGSLTRGSLCHMSILRKINFTWHFIPLVLCPNLIPPRCLFQEVAHVVSLILILMSHKAPCRMSNLRNPLFAMSILRVEGHHADTDSDLESSLLSFIKTSKKNSLPKLNLL